MATLQTTLLREKEAQFAFVKAFTKTATLKGVKAGKPLHQAAAEARSALEKSASFKTRKQLIADLEKIAVESDPAEKTKHEKLASLGFKEADVTTLKKVNPALLEKLASSEEMPWSFGAPSGTMTKEAQDPLLSFILN